MSGNSTIRLKAMLLSVVFTGIFLVVCHCSTAVSGPTCSPRMSGHCCCSRNAQPCKSTNDCPGTQAVKFNLMAKKVAASVQANAADAAAFTPRGYNRPGAVCPAILPSCCFPLPLYSPPDRLAFYHCYLV